MKKNSIKEKAPYQILFEDNHLLVINKACGVLVQGDKTGDLSLVDLLKTYIKETYHKPGNVYLGVVHRLDRPTSGVVVFAKTSKALSRLNEDFKLRRVAKTYHCLVSGKPDPSQAHLHHWLVRKPQHNKSYAHVKPVPQAKEAKLHYSTRFCWDHYSCLEIVLETGRHHQIRSQLSKIGHPIKGDLKYGAKRSNPDGGIDLHARKLVVPHPTLKKEMQFIAPYPKGSLWDDVASVSSVEP